MTEQEHLLTCLMEECAEIQQRVSKALRFGLYEIQPEQEYTNKRRIMLELYDLLGVIEMLQERKTLDMFLEREHVHAKKEKVLHFLEYAREQKAINDAPF